MPLDSIRCDDAVFFAARDVDGADVGTCNWLAKPTEDSSLESQIVEKLFDFCGTQRFTAAFTGLANDQVWAQASLMLHIIFTLYQHDCSYLCHGYFNRALIFLTVSLSMFTCSAMLLTVSRRFSRKFDEICSVFFSSACCWLS